MSYSFGTEVSMGEDVGAAIDKAYEESLGTYSDRAAVKATFDEVVPTAKRVALSMVAAVARPEDTVRVSISGHHNAGNEPTPGWSDCFMTVTVTQVPATAEAT